MKERHTPGGGGAGSAAGGASLAAAGGSLSPGGCPHSLRRIVSGVVFQNLRNHLLLGRKSGSTTRRLATVILL